MSVFANFILVESVDANGNTSIQRKFHNYSPGVAISWQGQSYDYLSFIYQGAAKNRSGDNMEAGLVMSSNPVSLERAREAVQQNWRVTVWTALQNDGGDWKALTQEIWLAASMVYDVATVEVLLSSAIDAVGAVTPSRVLTQADVGRLPTTGNVQAR